MNTLEIEKAFKSNKIFKNFICKVYAADSLPEKKMTFKKKHGIAIITNICNSSVKNSKFFCHWIAIFIPKNSNKIFIFDSSGLKTHLYFKEIKNFVKLQKRKIVYNKIQFQDNDSDICGQISLIYLFFHCAEINIKYFKKIFYINKKKLKENDVICKNLFKKIFKQ